MKTIKIKNFVFLFFFVVYLLSFNQQIYINNNCAYSNYVNFNLYRKYTFHYGGKIFYYSSEDYYKNNKISDIQKMLLNDKKYFKTLEMVNNIGLTKKEIVNYFFPEIIDIKDKLCKRIDISPEENYVEYVKNSCKINYIFGNGGFYLNQDDFYNKLYEMVLKNEKNISINIIADLYKSENDIKNKFKEKSTYFTDFKTSSSGRKNNIINALNSFDGIILDEGEILSFNKTTGIRSEENGYQKAKIISGGTFIDGFGGGVCQVSTTLYNAFLLAGLEILEVHNHSLPVSYEKPCFDAMVNSGSSDLIVRNNTDGKIIITTSSKDDICKVRIFGKENKYKIKKVSENIKVIPAENDYIDYDYLKYGDYSLNIGDELRLSYPKDGLIANGYLYYYDMNDVFLKKEKIRECKYNATKGIVIKRVS